MSDKTKKIIMTVVPVVLVAAVIAVSVYASRAKAMADEYKGTAESMYKRAFLELADGMDELEVGLSKLMVVTTPAQYVLILDDIWRQSGSCVSLMSQIPGSHLDTVDMNRFLVQLGDFAHSLTKKAVRGAPITGEDTEQIDDLHNSCIRLLSELDERIASGDLPVAAITGDEYFTAANEQESGQGDEYKENGEQQQFPTLIYDGPFSDSAEKAEAKGLSGEDCTEEQAMAAAYALAGDGASLSSQGLSDGRIPCYDFTGTTADGRTIDVSITVRGCTPLWFISSAAGDAGGMPDEAKTDALKKAATDYLDSMGYNSMRPTYAQYYGGAAVINCAATQDGVILYSDLIKVWVDMETEQVIGADARNYLFSHTDRDIKTPGITAAEAEAAVSDAVTVLARALALIPVSPENEVLCYEFKAKLGESEYIIYINAQTGAEEQIFRIIDTGDGTLVV